MSNRITDKMLESLCDIINGEMGTPLTKWTRHEDKGTITSNDGHYGIYRCLGVCSMVQVVGESGGERTIIHASTKGECYAKMQTWRDGVRAARKMLEATREGH